MKPAPDRHGKKSDQPELTRTPTSGQAGTKPGHKGAGKHPFTRKLNTSGQGQGEPDDPKGRGRKPR